MQLTGIGGQAVSHVVQKIVLLSTQKWEGEILLFGFSDVTPDTSRHTIDSSKISIHSEA